MATNVRSFGSFLERSIIAIHSGIDRANSINDPYYRECSIILISNAWELLAKALLIKHGSELLIYESGSRKEKTISAELSINKLRNLGYLNDIQALTIQQLISLRNEATHNILPAISDEILFHLEYYAIRYFKEILDVNFKNYSNKFRRKFLSVSFETGKTYTDAVRSLITKARSKKKPEDLRLAYLLERGVSFSGSEYIKQSDFDKQLLDKRMKRPMYSLKLGDYSRRAEMVLVVPIQAPSGTQAGIKLTKTISSAAISVKFDKKATDVDFPYLTMDLTAKLGVSRNILLNKIKELNIKGNPLYHQRVRASSKSFIQKYSDQCLNLLRNEFKR